MKYKLIIADDEQHIQVGLSEYIDWDTLGFCVVKVCDDGDEVIEFLESNPVDVVLTDIHMIRATGIDVAKYISDHHLSTRIVAISGYQDFEDARLCIKYHVSEYLLKPVGIEDVEKLFIKLKIELDEENRSQSLRKKNIQYYRESLPFLVEVFVDDLSQGILQDPLQITQRANMIGIQTDSVLCNYSTVEMTFSANSEEQSRDAAMQAQYLSLVRNLCYQFDSKLIFHLIDVTENTIELVVFDHEQLCQSEYSSYLNQQLHEFRENFRSIYDVHFLDCTIENYCDLSKFSKIQYISNYREKNLQKYNFLWRKKAYAKCFLDYINQNNAESIRLTAEYLFCECSQLDSQAMQGYVADIIREILSLSSLPDSAKNDVKDSVAALSDGKQLKEDIVKILIGMMNSQINTEEPQESFIIRQVKQYINENYNRNLSLDDVALHVMYSAGYLCKLFRQETGKNFLTYLIEVRMEKSIEFLKSGQYNICEISEMIGYKTVTHFSKLFKKYTGYTPSEYKRKVL